MGIGKKIYDKFVARRKPLEAGVYHLRREDAEYQARLHLRIDPGGEGLLMINAARIIYLNQTGAEMARYIIEEWPDDRIVREMSKRYRVAKKQLAEDLARLREAIECMARGDERCPISYLGVERVDPFTIEVDTPYRMDLALTYGCDNACAHCYNETPRAGEALSTEDFKRVIAKVWGLGIPHVCFTGGEPTGHPDLVELIAYAEELGVITGLLTNGRKLRDAAYMAALAEAGLDHVQITIESSVPEVHDRMVGCEGAFAETVEGIKNAVASPVYTVTNTTLTAKNADDVEELVAFLSTLGVEQMAANGIINSGGARDVDIGLPESGLGPILSRVTAACAAADIKFIWYTPTQYCRFNPLTMDLGVKQCTAAKYNMCVEPNGDVLPCQSYYQPLGNILKDDWDTIYNNELAKEIRERDYAPSRCRECPDLEICGAGCPLSVKYEKTFCCPDAASNPA
ncbi:MAG: radical SAM protein [Candidatus Zixiibacteriota bacterium]|jgi:radical SAM protein with 4Fe4S-binding SPASM domain